MNDNITLDGETADRIAALTIKQHRDWLVQDLERENLHDEDRGRNHRLIQCMDTLLNEYFQAPL